MILDTVEKNGVFLSEEKSRAPRESEVIEDLYSLEAVAEVKKVEFTPRYEHYRHYEITTVDGHTIELSFDILTRDEAGRIVGKFFFMSYDGEKITLPSYSYDGAWNGASNQLFALEFQHKTNTEKKIETYRDFFTEYKNNPHIAQEILKGFCTIKK